MYVLQLFVGACTTILRLSIALGLRVVWLFAIMLGMRLAVWFLHLCQGEIARRHDLLHLCQVETNVQSLANDGIKAWVS